MMKASLRVFVALFALVLAALASSASAGSASTSNKLDVVALPTVINSNATFQTRLNHVLSLARQAENGDKGAMDILKIMAKGEWDNFPKAKVGIVTFGVSKLKENKKLDNWGLDNGQRLDAAAAGGLVPYRSPAPAFSRNMLVSRDSGTPFQTEPHVCSNPEDPSNVIISVTDYGLPYNSVYTSFDAGETWRGPNRMPLTERTQFASDPVLACGRGNKTYHSFMSLGGRDYLLAGLPIDLTRSDIAVSTSLDGGLMWDPPTVVATNGAKIVGIQAGKEVLPLLITTFFDKEWISVGPDPNNPKKDVVYVSYTVFTDYTVILSFGPLQIPIPLQWSSKIDVWSSTDGAKTFKQIGSTPEVPGLIAGKSKDYFEQVEYQWVQGSQVRVADDGTLYVAWWYSMDDGGGKGKNRIYLVKTADRGKTWSGPFVASETLEIGSPRTAFFRNASMFPQMAVATVKGKKGEKAHNEVYIVHAALTAGKTIDDGDIYFVRGIDTGKTMKFMKPYRLNEDEGNALQFFPAVAVNRNGAVQVMWADTRDDPAGLKYHIYFSESRNHGKTWGFQHQGIREPDTRVTDFPSNPNKGFPRGAFIGDYFAIAPGLNGDAYLVWADTRLGEYGGMNQKIGFARRMAIPSPEIFLNPGRGSAGQEVTVQASNFQPDMQVYVKIGGQITAGPKTNEQGQAEMKILMPLTASEGVQEVMVFDESGNVAQGSFFSEVGINSLAKSADVDAVKGAVAKQNNSFTAQLNEAKKSQDTMETLLYVLLGLMGAGVLGGAGFLLKRKLRKEPTYFERP